MKQILLVIMAVLFCGAYATAGTVCINRNCVNGPDNGPVEIRQHNGNSQCFGSGCGTLETKSNQFHNRSRSVGDEEWIMRQYLVNQNKRSPDVLLRNNEQSLNMHDYPSPTPGMLYALTVVSGDVLSDIALRSDCSVDDLILINRRKFPDFNEHDLAIGQKVFLCWYAATQQRPREISRIK